MISIEDVYFNHLDESKEILKGLNLQIKSAQRVVIIGASGSGKTTILRLIAGFIAPTKGLIKFDEVIIAKDAKSYLPPYKRGISMVFQDLALWPHMNVEENVAFGLKMKNIPKNQINEDVKRYLSMVDLQNYNYKRIENLSGGEQQRVALARALIVKPKIVLMDEPLSSLDEDLNKQLRRKIVSLQKKLGFSLLYVTHNKEEAKEIGERIIVMKDGVIREKVENVRL